MDNPFSIQYNNILHPSSFILVKYPYAIGLPNLQLLRCYNTCISHECLFFSRTEAAMGEFRVHRVRFFEYQPKAIQCIVYGKEVNKVALSR